MNTQFLTWIAIAAVVGGGLLLFLGMPSDEQAEPLVLEEVSVEASQQTDDYWEPVTPVTSTAVRVPVQRIVSQQSVPCDACGVTQTVAATSVAPIGLMPCGSCGASQTVYEGNVRPQPCGVCGATYSERVRSQRCGTCGGAFTAEVGRAYSCSTCGGATQEEPFDAPRSQMIREHACAACGWVPVSPYPDRPVTPLDVHTCSHCESSAVPIYMQYPQVASCEQRVPSPCGSGPCTGALSTCTASCGSTCPLEKPGINRNMELCVDECTFVQLHTTLPHPICSDVRFEWTTNKGSFLESNVPSPIYYVPTTHFADGEDVWVVLKITDSNGVQYTDQLKLHVVNQR